MEGGRDTNSFPISVPFNQMSVQLDTTGAVDLVSCSAAPTPYEAPLSADTEGEMDAGRAECLGNQTSSCPHSQPLPFSQPSSQIPSKINTPRLQASEILLALSASAPPSSPETLTHSTDEAAATKRKRMLSVSFAPNNVLESDFAHVVSLPQLRNDHSEQDAKRPRTLSDIESDIESIPPFTCTNVTSAPAGSHRVHLPPLFQQQPHVVLASSSAPLPPLERYRSFSVSSVTLPLPPPLTAARSPLLSDLGYHLPPPTPLSASTSTTQHEKPFRHLIAHSHSLPSGPATPEPHPTTARPRLPSLSAMIASHQPAFHPHQPAPTPGHRRTTSTPLPMVPAPIAYKPKFKYTDTQKAVLQREFATNPYPSHARKEALGRETGTTATQVQFWFQNQRQKVARAGGGVRPVSWVGELVKGKGR